MSLCSCNLKENWSVQTVFAKERFDIKYALAEAATDNTGSPSSKYEHRRASALLRNIRNIRICMG